MPNIAQVLKEEMARVSRREIKKATATLHRSSAIYRREIAALKRHNEEMEREVKALSRERAKSGIPTQPPPSHPIASLQQVSARFVIVWDCQQRSLAA